VQLLVVVELRLLQPVLLVLGVVFGKLAVALDKVTEPLGLRQPRIAELPQNLGPQA